jgi:hypothetical protein
MAGWQIMPKYIRFVPELQRFRKTDLFGAF